MSLAPFSCTCCKRRISQWGRGGWRRPFPWFWFPIAVNSLCLFTVDTPGFYQQQFPSFGFWDPPNNRSLLGTGSCKTEGLADECLMHIACRAWRVRGILCTRLVKWVGPSGAVGAAAFSPTGPFNQEAGGAAHFGAGPHYPLLSVDVWILITASLRC